MIQVLPDRIANQIAAGEVVQRPASVVKELLENAVDAGADTIQLILLDAGSTLMQVIDNGCGMSRQDALMAFARHATSKISSIDDLSRLHTFGFRGEALASIASVAHVRLHTRRAEDECGCEVTASGNTLSGPEEISCPVGSDFSVRNLFFNVPARRKFLKTPAAEYKHIVEEFFRVALCHPDRTFSLTHDQQQQWLLPAVQNIRQRIAQVAGKDLANKLFEVQVDTSLVNIYGYVGKPEEAKKNGSQRYLFVNDRYFRSPYFHKAIMNAYEKLVPEGKTPSYFLYFQTDPQNIDVNIHPAKIEVKFEDESVLFQMLQAAIRESLGRYSLSASIDFTLDGALQQRIPIPHKGAPNTPAPRPCYDPLFNPFDTTQGSGAHYADGQAQTGAFGDSPAGAYADGPAGAYADGPAGAYADGPAGAYADGQMPRPIPIAWTPDTPADYAPTEDGVQTSFPYATAENTLAFAPSILQVRRKYLITPIKSGILIVHKRRAKERIYYEEWLQLASENASIPQAAPVQTLLYPVVLPVPPLVAQQVVACLPQFAALGYTFTYQEHEQSLVLSTVPQGTPIDQDWLHGTVYDLLEAFQEENPTETEGNKAAQMSEADRLDRTAAKQARQWAATQQESTAQEFQTIIDRLFACAQPTVSPFGKACYKIIPIEEIDLYF